ncbi:hypothetical protein LX87_05611 [Larkinella arboricola]|uniref:AbiJ N-terminal domain-containing protein n=1 Tax=Larkinella arboricola TaxID=643671 RepID=A0A327WGL4_LARAB|nr:hypothetical protein [Larkinella arboricola]RAJ89922.1 hypothetical protein LX87_05611 [Larkinella arboricola]
MNHINGKEIIDIKNQIASNFKKSDWLDFGYTLDSYDIIDNHSRLLRSLSFGDDDYEANILEVLTAIFERDPKNFNAVKTYLSKKYSTPAVSEFISTAHSEVPKKLISFAPQVFQVPDKPQNEKLVSVMLPFKLVRTHEAVKKACEDLNLECKKADDIWVNTTFIQDIFELIFTSHVVIADFTDKNPNVFYEVGIAHTLGKTVIPITQSIADVPSDLGHHRVLKYLPNEQGYEDLITELKKRLKTLVPKAFEF